jgi:hypothetical protein
MGRVILAHGSSAASATYGNIASAIKEYIISSFPMNFFNYMHISSELAFRSFRKIYGANSKEKEMVKRLPPLLVIRPSFSVPDDDLYLNGTIMTKNSHNSVVNTGMQHRYLINLINDKELGYKLLYRLNHDKIDFEFTITVETLNRQLDTMKFMLNEMIWDTVFSFYTSLEAVIPRALIHHICRIADIDITGDNVSNIPQFLSYLNNHSYDPITYKIRNASGRDEFFIYYKHKLLVTMYDLAIDEGSRKNMLDDQFNITVRGSVEVTLPGMFYLEGDSSYPETVKVELISMRTPFDAYPDFVPIYTMDNLFTKFPPYKDGKKLYLSSMFTTEAGKDMSDTLHIKEMLDRGLIRVLREDIAASVPPTTLLDIYIMKNKDTLVLGEHYTIDWEKLEVKILKADDTATYRIVIYSNFIQLNERLRDISIEEDIKDIANYKA